MEAKIFFNGGGTNTVKDLKLVVRAGSADNISTFETDNLNELRLMDNSTYSFVGSNTITVKGANIGYVEFI